MRRLTLTVLLAGCGRPDFASDDFSYSDEGWALQGNANMPTFSLERADEYAGPHICGDDKGYTFASFWRFQAPPKYTGNASTAYGKRITWDTATVTPGFPDAPLLPAVDLLLRGRGRTLVLNVPNVDRTSGQWVTFQVKLDSTERGAIDAGWTLESGGTASDDDIKLVLATLTALQLPGEWRAGPEQSCIDNVYFGTP